MREHSKTLDFIIVGGGLVGMVTAILLRHADFSVALVEQRAPLFQSHDALLDNRSLVLNQGSKRILETVGLWQALGYKARLVKQVHVSQEGGFAKTRFSAVEEGVEALGYVVPAIDMAQQCWESLATYGVEVHCPTTVHRLNTVETAQQVYLQDEEKPLQAQCVFIADGAHSSLRAQLGFTVTSKNYEQKAWVTQVQCQLPHEGVAYERFLKRGILALVPLKDPQHMGVIWSTIDAEANVLSLRDPKAFLYQLQVHMGYGLGSFLQCGAIHSFPLQQIMANTYGKPGYLLLGNAAHFLNPLAAQGLNVSIRDASVLRDMMVEGRERSEFLGSMTVLDRYIAQRQREHKRLAQFTHRVNGLFHSSSVPILGCLRGLGLHTLERITPLKRTFAKRTMGLHGEQSRLMRGLL